MEVLPIQRLVFTDELAARFTGQHGIPFPADVYQLGFDSYVLHRESGRAWHKFSVAVRPFIKTRREFILAEKQIKGIFIATYTPQEQLLLAKTFKRKSGERDCWLPSSFINSCISFSFRRP